MWAHNRLYGEDILWRKVIADEPEELTQESEEPMGELLVHEDEHSEPEGSPTPQGADMNNDFNELDLDTFKPAGDEPKTTPQRNAEEEAAELEALSQQIDGFNE